MKILVTGAKGFIGKNLVVALKRRDALVLWEYDVDSSPAELQQALSQADVIFHLAGVNRPENVEEYWKANTELTRHLCEALKSQRRKPVFVLSSSTQAALDNPYGISKRLAEDIVLALAEETGAQAAVFRLPGVFGKWCRPDYNSVVATFCHNIARDLPIAISDPEHELELVYIDDVVSAFIGIMEDRYPFKEGSFYRAEPSFRVTLGNLAGMIQDFRESRRTLRVPDFSDEFARRLYATYLSYLPIESFAYGLDKKADKRGELAEILKSAQAGQIFLSRTRPGCIRGNHYHDTKVEKFAVIDGDAVIRFRHILEPIEFEYAVSGKDFRVVDIPPGYTHSIENVGHNDLVVLFWANELFDPSCPDTYPLRVRQEKEK
jgi:UDP-2-acetamido-2,6-beta-L-arabino-hexul-4-ose reductase